MSVLNLPRHPRTFQVTPRAQPAVSTISPPASFNIDQHFILDPLLKRYWKHLIWYKWQIFFCFLIGCMIGLTITGITPTMYRATAQVMIEIPSNLVSIDTQTEFFKNRVLADNVINQLNLSENEIYLSPPSMTFDNWLDNTHQSIKSLYQELLYFNNQSQVELFLSQLNIEPIKNSTIIRVHYQHSDPALAQQIANEVVNQGIILSQPQTDSIENTSIGISQQLDDTKEKLEIAEINLAQYATKYQIIIHEGIQNPSIDRLSQLEASVTEAEKLRIDAESTYDNSRKGEKPQFIIDNPTLRTLQETHNRQQAEFQEKLKFYKHEYPEMITLQEQINITKQQIANTIETLLSEIKTRYISAKQKEDTLRKELEQQRNTLLTLRENMVGYDALRREVETQRNIYEGLLQSLRDIKSTTTITETSMSILEPAMLPHTPFRPNLAKNLALASSLGLLFGLLLAFFRNHLDETIKNKESLEVLLNLPVLGYIPKNSSKSRKKPSVQFPFTVNATTESYQTLKANLLLTAPNANHSIIHITSAQTGEGKTDVCYNLGCSFAMSGKRVLLIDTNLRRPTLHQRLDVGNSKGFSHLFHEESDPRQLIRVTAIPNLHLITAGSSVHNPIDLLLNSKVEKLFELVAHEFDFVILDSPALCDGADALLLSHWANATLLVAQYAKSNRKRTLNAYRKLIQAHAHVIGSVLTKVKKHHNVYY